MERGKVKKDLTVLRCNTEYPTPMEDVNLGAMLSINQECGVKVGYSDYTLGIKVPIAAVAMGAKVIEKHFTLDRNLPGHRATTILNGEAVLSIRQDWWKALLLI